MGAGHRRDRPRKTPAVAVKHRQRPQIHRMRRHRPYQYVRHGVRVGAAVRVNDTFWIAGRARRVVQRDCVPFVGGRSPRVISIAFGEKRFVVEDADPFAGTVVDRVIDIDDQQLAIDLRQCGLDRRRKLAIGDQDLRLAVVELKRDRGRIKSSVQRIQHRSGHRNAKVRLDHWRRVGQHHRNRIAAPDAALRERGRKLAAAAIQLRPRQSQCILSAAMNDGRQRRKHGRRALQKWQRRQRRKVGQRSDRARYRTGCAS